MVVIWLPPHSSTGRRRHSRRRRRRRRPPAATRRWCRSHLPLGRRRRRWTAPQCLRNGNCSCSRCSSDPRSPCCPPRRWPRCRRWRTRHGRPRHCRRRRRWTAPGRRENRHPSRVWCSRSSRSPHSHPCPWTGVTVPALPPSSPLPPFGPITRLYGAPPLPPTPPKDWANTAASFEPCVWNVPPLNIKLTFPALLPAPPVPPDPP